MELDPGANRPGGDPFQNIDPGKIQGRQFLGSTSPVVNPDTGQIDPERHQQLMDYGADKLRAENIEDIRASGLSPKQLEAMGIDPKMIAEALGTSDLISS